MQHRLLSGTVEITNTGHQTWQVGDTIAIISKTAPDPSALAKLFTVPAPLPKTKKDDNKRLHSLLHEPLATLMRKLLGDTVVYLMAHASGSEPVEIQIQQWNGQVPSASALYIASDMPAVAHKEVLEFGNRGGRFIVYYRKETWHASLETVLGLRWSVTHEAADDDMFVLAKYADQVNEARRNLPAACEIVHLPVEFAELVLEYCMPVKVQMPLLAWQKQ